MDVETVEGGIDRDCRNRPDDTDCCNHAFGTAAPIEGVTARQRQQGDVENRAHGKATGPAAAGPVNCSSGDDTQVRLRGLGTLVGVAETDGAKAWDVAPGLCQS